MIEIRVEGDFKNTEGFLRRLKERRYLRILNKYGEAGVNALTLATPKDTGITAGSWGYEIVQDQNGYVLYWTNTNNVDDWFYVAVALQYGHGTGTGGYVVGRDYINPAMRPIFDKIADDAWKEVTSA